MYIDISLILKTKIEPNIHLFFVDTVDWKGNVYLDADAFANQVDFRGVLPSVGLQEKVIELLLDMRRAGLSEWEGTIRIPV